MPTPHSADAAPSLFPSAPRSGPGGDALLADLNDAQRRAVLHPAEPLIVLAGPGTGKTRVITHRIAHQIETLGIEPESIVAVTFTIKAANQLRDRLRELVGASKADRVNASTFHALGMRILQRFGDTLTRATWELDSFSLNDRPVNLGTLPLPSHRRRTGGAAYGPSLTRAGLVDSAQKRRLLRAIIQQADLFRPSRVRALDDAANIAARGIETLSELAVFPDDCHRFITHWRAALDKRISPADAAATLDDEALHAQREALSHFTEIARAYAIYDRALRHAGLITFADLITLPIRLLRQPNSRAGAVLRDQWRHFVVDEFQDVNPAQLEFLRQLAPAQGTPDLCIVGDDDQAIYGFRGSDQRAFARFAAIWKGPDNRPPAMIELQENYRSDPTIVAAANSIISQSQTRFARDKVIRAAKRSGLSAPQPTAPIAPGVVGVYVDSDSQSGTVIGAMVQTIRAELASSAKPAAAGDTQPDHPSIAVVTRNHLTTDRVVEALRLEGIAVRTPRSASILDDRGVKDVMAWINLLVNPSSTYDARWLLSRPPTVCKLEDLAHLERAFGKLRDRIATRDPDAPPEPRPMRPAEPRPDDETLARHYLRFVVAQTKLNESLAQSAARLLSLHDDLSAFAAAGNTAEETIRQIISRTGAAHAELLSAPDRTRRIASLVAMLRFAGELQPKLDAPGDLRAFLAYYKDLDGDDQGMTNLGDIDERLDNESPETDIVASTPIGSAEAGSSRVAPSISDTLSEFMDDGTPPDSPNTIGSPAAPDGISGSRATPAARFPPVHILNAHKAKGLEFDIVFVPCVGAQKGNYGAKGQKRDDEFEQPPGLIEFVHPELAVGESPDAEREEERRVFYVAATRARARLILMTKRLKNRSGSVHYFQELTDDPAVAPSFNRVGVNDVFEQAARAGVKSGSGAPLVASQDDEELATDAFERARRSSRLLAAEALDLADRPGLDAAALDQLADRLRDAAAHMSIISHIQTTNSAPPASLIARAPNRAAAAALAEQLGASARAAARGNHALITPGLPAPLQLSFSQINAYLKCPRCYYLHRVLGLPERHRTAEIVGSVVHRVIEQYLKALRTAEIETLAPDAHGDVEETLPSHLTGAAPLKALLRIARDEFAREAEQNHEIDGEQFVRIEAILQNFIQKFHRPTDHILEIEHFRRFPFRPVAFPPAGKPKKTSSRSKSADDVSGEASDLLASIGTGHTLSAKIDRIDQFALPDGSAGFRIIDYKTGRPSKGFREPKADDLQLGIYALALNDLYNTGNEHPLRGVAEYWLLASGDRGGIPLETLNLHKVTATIAKVIKGMLAGDFEPGGKCKAGSDCSIFEPSGFEPSGTSPLPVGEIDDRSFDDDDDADGADDE